MMPNVDSVDSFPGRRFNKEKKLIISFSIFNEQENG
jgi:hypothetical protein